MPEKLLTLRELSEHLLVKEDKITELVDQGVISAYKIGGELLRFRKDQIAAVRAEIDTRINEADRIPDRDETGRKRKKISLAKRNTNVTLREKIADFFYFNDFYILSAVIIIGLVVFIFRG